MSKILPLIKLAIEALPSIALFIKSLRRDKHKKKKCTCDAQDLQPLGECICRADQQNKGTVL